MRRLVAGLLPVVVLVLAGCTAGNQAAPDGQSLEVPGGEIVTVDGVAGEPVAEIPVISTEAQMLSYTALPLDAYSIDLDRRIITQAHDKLVAECVAEKGFNMGPYRPVFADPPPRLPRLRQFGVGIMAEVQQYGYETPPKYSGPTPPPPPPPMSQALEIALYGPVEERPEFEPLEIGEGLGTIHAPFGFTPDSCLGRAWAALEVADYREISVSNGSTLVTNLVFDTFYSAKADSRTVAADTAWSACMRDAGFDVPSPDDSATTYSQLGRAASIPAATADVECKYAMNYFGIRYGVESAYQKAAIEESFQELEQIAAEHRVTLEKAKAVLNG